MTTDDIIVRLRDMPASIKGFVSPSPDGAYNVYINARQSYETQQQTCEHEIRHILNCDFESDEPVMIIEK